MNCEHRIYQYIDAGKLGCGYKPPLVKEMHKGIILSRVTFAQVMIHGAIYGYLRILEIPILIMEI